MDNRENRLSLEEIQSWWEVPCIAHFTHLVEDIIKEPVVSVEELESGILLDDLIKGNCFLTEFVIRLLKKFVRIKGVISRIPKITHANLCTILRSILRITSHDQSPLNVVNSLVQFQSLPIPTKLAVILKLFERVTNCIGFHCKLEIKHPPLRVEPLGCDSKNSTYWYFSGKRLYCEHVNEDYSAAKWEIICFTRNDWERFANTFKESNNLDEYDLYTQLMHKIKNFEESEKPIPKTRYSRMMNTRRPNNRW